MDYADMMRMPELHRRLMMYAGRFDPFCLHHRDVVKERLLPLLEKWRTDFPDIPVSPLVIWPVGPYGTKDVLASSDARKEMLYAGLGDLIEAGKVVLETHDLDYPDGGYTPTIEMQARYAIRPLTELHEEHLTMRATPYELTQVWHAIGADNVPFIQGWEEGHMLWKHARFVILMRDGTVPADLPRKHQVVDAGISGSAQEVRALISAGKPWQHLVPKGVASCIKRRGLYGCPL